jgi:hypothetical protein
MWYPGKRIVTYVRENALRDEAIDAGCKAVDVARASGASDADIAAAGNAAVQEFYDRAGVLKSAIAPPKSAVQNNLMHKSVERDFEALIERKPQVRDDEIKCAIAIRQIAIDAQRRYFGTL